MIKPVEVSNDRSIAGLIVALFSVGCFFGALVLIGLLFTGCSLIKVEPPATAPSCPCQPLKPLYSPGSKGTLAEPYYSITKLDSARVMLEKERATILNLESALLETNKRDAALCKAAGGQ